jgi:hypothetical protein
MKKTMVALLAGAMLMMATSAMALSIRLTDGNTSFTVNDGGPGDTNAVAGVVGFSGAVGDFIVNVSTGISYPILGSSVSPSLDLNSVDVSYNGLALSNTLTIYLTDTGFSSPSTIGGFTAHIGGTTTGTVKYSTYLDASNTAFGETTQLTNTTYNGPNSFSGGASSLTDLSSLVSLYSLTQEVEITHAATGGSSSFDATLQPIPEPGTMMLVGLGMLGMAVYGKRRMNKEA